MSGGSTPIEVSEGTVTVRGVELFVRAAGSGPDVVVLHGGPGAHHDYLLPQFDALAQDRRLRYYDQRGGGRSPVGRDVPVGWREHVADLVALLDHWQLDRASILGYSWGGLLAMLFTTEHERRVERLALVSPAAGSRAARDEFERRFAERMSAPENQGAREALRTSGLRERDPEAYRQRAFELSVAGYFKDPARAKDLTPFRITGRTQQEVWKSLGDYNLDERLRSVTVPALVAHGRYDPMPIESARQTAALMRAEFVVFEDSGHVPYVEQLDEFVRVLDQFLPTSA